MASDATGLLYAVGRSSSELVTIDASTGVVTVLGTLSFGEADALAFSIIPEPSTWVLLMLALGGGGVFGRGRRAGVKKPAEAEPRSRN